MVSAQASSPGLHHTALSNMRGGQRGECGGHADGCRNPALLIGERERLPSPFLGGTCLHSRCFRDASKDYLKIASFLPRKCAHS